MGADAVLVNTAIAVADDPDQMAQAFALAVQAGRMAYESGPGALQDTAAGTSPLTMFLNKDKTKPAPAQPASSVSQ